MPIGRDEGKWFVWMGLRVLGKLPKRVNGFLGDGDFAGVGT